MAPPSLLVLGPQTPLPSAEYLSRIRSGLLNDARLANFLAAIKALPSLWPTLAEANPSLSQVPGAQLLEDIKRWVEQGDFPAQTVEALPNVQSTPLTVIIQIVEYFNYISHAEPGLSHAKVLESVRAGGIQGFCTGFLAAVALACSKDEREADELAAVALRLAVCIGAEVDLDGRFASPPREFSCLTVRWTPAAGKQQVLDVLQEFPESYVSVITDITSATVTVPASAASSLIRRLSEKGVKAKPISLNGRFHSPQHKGAVETLKTLCSSNAALRFPEGSHPLVPLRTNSDAELVTADGVLHEIALRCMLSEVSNWHLTVTTSASMLSQPAQKESQHAVVIGLIDCIPRPMLAESNLRVTALRTMEVPGSIDDIGVATNPSEYTYPEHAVAIVGTACRFPGADSLEEFWEVIESGRSMLGELPEQRFPRKGLRRSPDENTRFRGNFLRDADAFDHRFFKKSSREAASMDPQHRLILQVAYEALESAGYFNEKSPAKDIGCYMGVAASDYEDNVASHMPTAFSVLGMVRAFVSGKISHFFGLSGPSMVFDTACSSSAVAIHTACRAIQNDECSMAIAGGVNVITSPILHQNLAAANFLSPTGASKAFDAKADGYCRGEGAGLVVLKKLSAALADNDNILGVIVGSAVNQNDNSAPITVPVSPSQTKLYQRVLSLANMDPKKVSFVEAHGTGTPKGDPIECASIREVFANQPDRKLHFGSVKGNIGHTEAASGAAGLIKVLLMMQHKTIPPHASFTSLNPNIPPLEPSNMVIPTAPQRWNPDFYAACINNYGAAGSNAALLVCQPPPQLATARAASTGSQMVLLPKYPITITANSANSLQEYCKALKVFLTQHSSMPQEKLLASIAFNLAQKQNLALPYNTIGSVTSLPELDRFLSAGASKANEAKSVTAAEAKPVVLVFAGQTGDTVSFSEELYRSSYLLRSHLNQCDNVLRSMGLKGLFPGIFKQEPIEDVVDLHCMLFSLQYSCAKAWIDSGLEVKSVIGHSFGQLTALCVSGALSLEDTLKLISGRASLIKTKWGNERGSMITVDASLEKARKLVSLANEAGHKVEIACYNGPTSYVVVGTEASIDGVEETVTKQSSVLGPIKTKRLSVTHGFHSEFVENILLEYTKLAETLTYRQPTIPIETCSEGESWTDISASLVAQQSRAPVYFGDAVARIEQRLGACTWVEAGLSTAAIPMARRAVPSTGSAHSFHAVKLDPAGSLAETTIGLWKVGVKVQFWPFHGSQRHSYVAMNLPPYQFEKARHWLEYIDKHGAVESVVAPPLVDAKPTLLSFVQYSDAGRRAAEFSVDQRSEQYQALVRGHAVLGSTLCPASLYVEMAARAATMLQPDAAQSTHVPHVEDLGMYAPLGIDLDRGIRVTLTRVEGAVSTWQFALNSYARNDLARLTQHATGRISLLPSGSPKTIAGFARYERLINYERCEGLFADASAEAIQGSLVYKMFAKVVNYSDIYRGVKKISSKNREVAGHVIMPAIVSNELKESVSNPLAVDNFTQVAGLHVNGLEDCGDNEVFVCTKIDELQVGRDFNREGAESGPWIVYSNFERKGERELVNDIFILDAARKTVVMTILGVRFTKVVISSLRKALFRANSAQESAASGYVEPVRQESRPKSLQVSEVSARIARAEPRSSAKPKEPEAEDIRPAVRKLLNEVADVPIDEITDDAGLEELGIDSLMATELLSAIRETFEVNISQDDFQTLGDFKSLAHYIGSRRVTTASSDSSTKGYDSDDYSNTNTPETDASTPISSTGSETSHSELVARLSKLVAEHLDVDEHISRDTNLGDAGMDSLLGIELGVDIEKAFGKRIDMMQLNPATTFGDLSDMIIPQEASKPATTAAPPAKAEIHAPAAPVKLQEPTRPDPAKGGHSTLAHSPEDFASIRDDYARFAKETGWFDFRTKVYPQQAQLVLAYVVEAFAALGCPLATMKSGEQLPDVPHIPKHGKVVKQYYKVLEEASLIFITEKAMIRTATPVNPKKASQIFEEMVPAFPQHASELKLLNSTGSKLADCLSGKVDPLQVLFRSKVDRDLLEDVYTNSPMFATGTKVLGNFFIKTFSKYSGSKLRILELGAGTGGTTKHIINLLLAHGIEFTYTYTDLSSSMVAAAKRKFAQYDFMEYMVLDVEKPPPERLLNSYHTILSSNCVHATKSLLNSSINIHKLLRSDGFLCLLELTRNLYWLDCVFGLLEGWWLFEDGRKHVLADELTWKRILLEAGFKHVDWSDDDTPESDQFRVITGFVSEFQSSATSNGSSSSKAQTNVETVEFHKAGETSLFADIYYPTRAEATPTKRPIALMVHGGGHIMLSRKDIRPKQTRLLLENGLLPVSVDYRLCPEVTLTEGPIPDVCTALQWARDVLPTLKLQRSDVIPDGEKVVIIGWSTGGTLSMTTAWNAPQRGVKPPDAILAFYCPSDYESEFWRQPNYPEGTAAIADQEYDILEGIQDHPITAYNVPAGSKMTGNWMSTSDPRSRIALHMNWKGQALPTLLDGLPPKSKLSASEGVDPKWLARPIPDAERIAAVSPYAQITRGTYNVPTFLVHGTKDDLVPWQHTQKIRDALAEKGVPTGVAIVDGGVHLFDLYRDADGKHWQAVLQGYEFLFTQLGLSSSN